MYQLAKQAIALIASIKNRQTGKAMTRTVRRGRRDVLNERYGDLSSAETARLPCAAAKRLVIVA